MDEGKQKNIKKHSIILSMIVVGMFGFGFALVPFYNALCKVAGLNGKTQINDVILPDIPIDGERLITVELISALNEDMPANFYPQAKKFTIHPGQFVETNFWVENLSDQHITFQAIPSVAPGLAGNHVKKQVCFCFQNQDIDANQKMKLPLRFTVHPDLPKKYSTVTLAYTLFDVTKDKSQDDRKI